MAVHFFFADTLVTLRHRTNLKKFIKTIFEEEGYLLDSVNYIFCSDEYLLDINRRFLKHDYYTDIVTFDLSKPKNPIESEIYISVDRVRDNALHLNEPFKFELHRVIFHGALHLCGYKDKTKREKLSMRAREAKYLELYFS